MVVEAVNPPDVPVIVTVLGPTAVVLLVVKITVDVLVVGLVEKLAVTPAGRLVAESVTLPEKPFCGATSRHRSSAEVPWPTATDEARIQHEGWSEDR